MIKRYLGIALISASMAFVVGCSSDDDDDPMMTTGGETTGGETTGGETTGGETTGGETTGGETTGGETTGGETTGGETTGGETTGGETTGGETTGGSNAGSITNNTVVNTRGDSLLKFVHTTGVQQEFVVAIANNDFTAPLIGPAAGSTDPNSEALSDALGQSAYIAVPADTHDIDIVNLGEFLSNSTAAPTVASVNPLTVSAGTSTTIVFRGNGTDSTGDNRPFEALAMINEAASATAGNAKIRVVHAARGLNILGPLDVYVNGDGTPTGTPALSGFTYDTGASGYLEVAAGDYAVVATAAGDAGTERIPSTGPLTFAAGSVTTVVVRDLKGGAFSSEGVETDLVIINDLGQ
ncbi:MAG: DUF4397 domain-containing protein [Gammaproteobacteria bacterium]|nr:DUF4397 domain-containing protein [Gammaproteobacteria bacterium]